MSIVTVLQPPAYADEHFELCYTEGLGLIVFCKKCEVASLVWDSTMNRWLIPPDDIPATTYTIACWCCGKLFHRPSLPMVQRFKEVCDDRKTD